MDALIDLSAKYPFATNPEGIAPSLLAHFNSMDVNVMLRFYHEDAILVGQTGEVFTGPEAMAAELEKYMSFGLPMVATARNIFVAGDMAEVVLDWSISGKGPGGQDVNITGVASDIARKGADGLWRYQIDNPMGTAIR